ncbi:MAG: phage holin family protein, partial [Saprospiraceae bacterium]|nr:phage holin family protein [Saprospiraceae bacterium]
MDLLIKLLLNGLALFAAAYLLRPHVRIDNFVSALITALVLAVLNATLGAILNFLSLPLNFLTLGLFHFVVDALILLLANHLLKGFQIRGFWWALALA